MSNRDYVRGASRKTAGLTSGRQIAAGLAVLSAMVAGVLIGCGPEAAGSKRPGAVSEPPPVAASAVHVKPVNRSEFAAHLNELRGNVVLVDCWATWCMPCMAQLPHTLELAQRLKDRGLVVVTLNFDDVDSAAKVETVLNRDGLASHSTNLICKSGGSTKAMDEFEIPSGALPHYKFYDRAGKLRRTIGVDDTASEQFSTADVDAAVEELLAE